MMKKKYIYKLMEEYCQSLYEGDKLREDAVVQGKTDFSDKVVNDLDASREMYAKQKHYYNLKYTWKYCFDYFAAASAVYIDELKSRGQFRKEWDVASIGCGTGSDYWALDMARFILSDPRKEEYQDCRGLRSCKIHYRGYDQRPVERFPRNDSIGDQYEYSEGGIEAWYSAKEINDLIFFGRSVKEVFRAESRNLEEQAEVKARIDRFVSILTDKLCKGKKEDPVYLVMVYPYAPDQGTNDQVIEMQCGSCLISKLEHDSRVKTEMIKLPLDHVGYLEEKTLEHPENYSGVQRYLRIVETQKNALLSDEECRENFPEIWQFELSGKGRYFKTRIDETLRDVSRDPNEYMLFSDKYSAYHILKISKCS